MKVTYLVGERFTFEIEASTVKEVFEKLSPIAEVLEEKCCGACKSKNIRPLVREVEGNKFYELVCGDCKARLAYGCHRQGNTLFLKRKDDDGNFLPNQGWTKWTPGDKDKPAQPDKKGKR